MAVAMAKTENRAKVALDHIRAAAQELHGAISDAATKSGGAVKHDLEVIPQKAKAVTESVRSSMDAQNAAAKKRLAEAITNLEATQKHAAESSEKLGPGIRDFGQTSPRRCARLRSEDQRSRRCSAFGRIIQAKHQEIGVFHAQLHHCGL